MQQAQVQMPTRLPALTFLGKGWSRCSPAHSIFQKRSTISTKPPIWAGLSHRSTCFLILLIPKFLL